MNFGAKMATASGPTSHEYYDRSHRDWSDPHSADSLNHNGSEYPGDPVPEFNEYPQGLIQQPLPPVSGLGQSPYKELDSKRGSVHYIATAAFDLLLGYKKTLLQWDLEPLEGHLWSEWYIPWHGRDLCFSKESDSAVDLTNRTKTHGRDRVPSHRIVEGYLDGFAVSACPDTGSVLDIMSSEMAKRFGFEINKNVRTQVELPNGRIINSLGTVTALFRFKNEITLHKRIFHVQECVQDLVLGLDFLRSTSTLVKSMWSKRVKSIPKLQPGALRSLLLVGSTHERLRGYFNAIGVEAIPDTGSDINVISGAFAKQHGLKFDSARRIEVQLADGSTVWTSGIVKDAAWAFDSFQGFSFDDDFHVLDMGSLSCAPFDVILGHDFVFEHDVYEKFERDLYSTKSLSNKALCYLIKEVYQGEIPGVIPDPIRAAMNVEMDRRDDWDELMARLPRAQQDLERSIEALRRQDWLRQMRQLAAAQVLNPTPTGADAAGNTQAPNRPPLRARWRQSFRRFL